MIVRSMLAFLTISLWITACNSTPSEGDTSSGSGGNGGGAASSSTGASSSSGGLEPGQCRIASDCAAIEYCSAVNLPPFCGGQCDQMFNNDCQMDSDCADAGVGTICDNPCRCPYGGAQVPIHCTPGCMTDADCGPSLTCSAMHRCEPRDCTQDSDCTPNFACVTDAGGSKCTPKTCTADADCGNFCINGACSATMGSCMAAVP